MIDHQGEAESITQEEIEWVYEIATIHVGHPSNFYGMVSDCEELVGGQSQEMKGMVLWGFILVIKHSQLMP